MLMARDPRASDEHLAGAGFLGLARDGRIFYDCSAFKAVKQFRPVSMLIDIIVDGSTVRASVSRRERLLSVRSVGAELLNLEAGGFDGENVQLRPEDSEAQIRKRFAFGAQSPKEVLPFANEILDRAFEIHDVV